ncbi:hypothetical protein GGI19_006307, partial [Coemansia pectinata]
MNLNYWPPLPDPPPLSPHTPIIILVPAPLPPPPRRGRRIRVAARIRLPGGNINIDFE